MVMRPKLQLLAKCAVTLSAAELGLNDCCSLPIFQRCKAWWCRWVEGGWPALESAGRLFNTTTAKDQWGRPVLLFRNAFALQQVVENAKGLGKLSPYALPPQQ